MNARPVLLDLYCCAGGAARGYADAGFDVVGVDIVDQPNYPFEFHQADAIEFVTAHGGGFDAVHASPPCQRYSLAQRIRSREHPDLVGATRQALVTTGRPWVIENVEGAPLENPVLLCGAMFPGLRVYRHRLFETTFPLPVPPHPQHMARLTKMGRPPAAGEFMHVVGNFSGVQQAREAMGIDWMTRDGLREAIPPAYTHHIGGALLRALTPRLGLVA
ncbi:DNA methylase [Saccharopolyspora sp. CA-218241]|uniref:DNA methylase n=1 Tax=Saccharopolyspora sp. CA-218241 TaxID=3240027 RepID=UPI003D972F5E